MYCHWPVVSYLIKAVNFRLTLLFVSYLCFHCSSLQSADIFVKANLQKKDVSHLLEIYTPKSIEAANLERAKRLFETPSLFKKNNKGSLLLGDSKYGYWIKGRVLTTQNSPSNVVIRLIYNHYKEAAFFVKKLNGELSGEMSYSVSEGNQKLRDNKLAYSLNLDSPIVEFLIYVQPQGVSYNVYNIHVNLQTLENYDNDKLSDLLFFSLVFGFLIAMFIYNLIIYIYVGYTPYLYYCAYLASLLLIEISATGFGYITFLDLSSETMINVLAIAPAIAFVSILQFGRVILSLNTYSIKIDRFYKGLQLVGLLSLPLVFTSFGKVYAWLLLAQIVCVSSLGVVAWNIHKKNKQAGALAFSLSFLVIALGAILHVALEIFPGEYLFNSSVYQSVYQWMEHNVFVIASMIEMMMLSVVLSSFIRKAEIDKRLAQEGRLEMLSQSLALKEQYSLQLEIDVKERTKELNESNLELKKLQQLRDRFFSYVSHEFRSPLTLALGPLSEVKAGKFGQLNGSLTKVIELVEKNTYKVLNLVNRLLELSRLNNARLDLKLTKINAVKTIDELLSEHEFLVEKKKINLTVDKENVNDCDVWFDSHYFETVFQNLITNACKYTPDNGMIRVSYHLNGENLEGRYLEVRIANSGSYISPEKQKLVFNYFYKGRSGKETAESSVGVGLAIVKDFVELHQGSISVESSLDKLTIFKVKLWLGNLGVSGKLIQLKPFDFLTAFETVEIQHLKTDDETINDKSSHKIKPAEKGEKTKLDVCSHEDSKDVVKVLVVDDNPELCRYLSQILHEAGYSVVIANDGEEAYLLCQSLLPDIIVSDLIMPKSDGVDLIKNIRQNEELKHLPFILLTSTIDKNSLIDSISHGADEYLTKPFIPQELLVKIKRILEQRKILSAKFSQFKIDAVSEANTSVKEGKSLEKSVYQLVIANISDPKFGVAELAEKLHMNRTSLYRKLKSQFNITANEMILDIRLNQSRKLLEQDVRIIDVAFTVGFNSQSYYSKKFLEKFNMTPSQWRKRHFNRQYQTSD